MMINKHAITAILLVATVGLGCSFFPKKGGAYQGTLDNFSIDFPAGSGDVKVDSASANWAPSGRTYSKNFDGRSENYRTYEVQAWQMDPSRTDGKDLRTILEIGLNGWGDEPGTVVRDVTVNGRKGIDSVRTMELGPVKMTFRHVVFWSEKTKTLFIVGVTATKKENVATTEADAFVNSFDLGD